MPDDTTVYRQPSVRQATTWTPALVRSALVNADGGYLRQAADLCDELLGDDRCGGVFETRVGGLLGLDLTFEEGIVRPRKAQKRAVDEVRSPQVVALEDDGDWWTLFPEGELYQILVWGLLLGVCPARLKWPEKADARGRLVPTAEWWHPRTLRYDWTQRKWFIRTGDSATEVELTPGEDGWLLFCPYGAFRPWAQGLWRGLARWWLLKSYAIDDWGRHSENASKVVAADEAGKSSKDQRRELASDLYECARDAVVVLPPGFSMKLVEATAHTRRSYEAQKDAADAAFAISVLGQNLTTNVEGGSFAAAKVHSKVEARRVSNTAEGASTFTHEQGLKPYAEVNWGNEDLAPWALWDVDPPEDAKAKAETIKTIAEAASMFNNLGIRLDPEQLRLDYGVPIAEVQPEPPAGEGEPKAASAAQAAREAFIRAASGFVEGQLYSDALADHGKAHGAKALEGFLSELLEFAAGVEDLETARAKLLEWYGDKAPPPEEFAEMTEKLLTLGLVAGLAAVKQDAPEGPDAAN